MNAPVTRRALLGATAAIGAVGLPVLVETASSPACAAHPDAGLFGLIARHSEAVALTDASSRACDGPLARFEALQPGRPAALDFAFNDFSHDLGGAHGREPLPDGKVRHFYSYGDVQRIAAAPPMTRWESPSDEVEPYRVPCPIGEARRREIVRASNDWHAARHALSEALGLRAANQACDAALEAEVEVEDAIVAAVPATLEGLRAKAARIIASPSEEAGDRALDLLHVLASIGEAAS